MAPWSSQFPTGGNDLYVDAAVVTKGVGSVSSPFKTISEAARVAEPGDVIHILPGIYAEQVAPPRSGTPSAWIHYRGDGDGVILDGGRTLSTDSGWINDGEGVYHIAFNRGVNYVTLDTVRLFQHASLDSLRADGAGITGGYVTHDGSLYVKAPDLEPLTGRVLRVAEHAFGFLLSQRSHIVIENLEIRHFDAANISLRDAGEGNVIRRNEVRGVFNGIYLGQWTQDYPEENALENDVYDNVLTDIVDDGLEPECQAINLRMYGNRFKRVFSPISLTPSYPNPFNGDTVVPYELATDTRVELAVFNLVGQRVVTLVDGWQQVGGHAPHWDGRDGDGDPQASGLYLSHLRTSEHSQTRKMVLLR